MLGLLLLNEDAGVSIPMLYDLGSYFAVCKASGLGPTDFVPSAITPLTVVHIHTAHSKRLKGDIYISERVVIKIKKKCQLLSSAAAVLFTDRQGFFST